MTLRQKIYWHKSNPPPQAFKVKWQDAVEEMIVATKNKGQGHAFNHELGQRHNVIETPICMGNERFNHPTQKPEALFEPIIKFWSRQEAVILDPFCGTGTVCVVAKKLGRNYVGIELNPKYVELARKRLEAVPPRLDTFL